MKEPRDFQVKVVPADMLCHVVSTIPMSTTL